MAKIAFLKKQNVDLLNIQDNLVKIQDNLLKELHSLNQRQSCVDSMPFVQMGSKHFEFYKFSEARNGQSETC